MSREEIILSTPPEDLWVESETRLGLPDRLKICCVGDCPNAAWCLRYKLNVGYNPEDHLRSRRIDYMRNVPWLGFTCFLKSKINGRYNMWRVDLLKESEYEEVENDIYVLYEDIIDKAGRNPG